MILESPGTLVGSYEVIQRLEGQASEVYLARRHGQEQGREFLLVLFEVSEDDARRIEEEVDRCKRLDHPAIVRIVEMFEHGGKRALVFGSVPGTNLHRLIRHLGKEGERLADRAVYHIGHALFGALAEAHLSKDEAGKTTPIVHGQLGPQMVLVSWRGAVTILGFGMSRVFRLAESLLAESDELRPSMAPEVRAGYAPTPRANVYSVAAMLWSLFTQQVPPLDGEKPESLAQLRPDLPRSVATVLDQALEPAFTQRNITCRELAGVFERLAGSEGRRELRWNMEVFRELDNVDAGFIPPESLPPSKLSDVPEPATPPPMEQPDSDEALLEESKWEVPKRPGSYALIGGRRITHDGKGADKTADDGARVPLSDSAVPTPRVADLLPAAEGAAKAGASKRKTAGNKIGRVATPSDIKRRGKRGSRKATLVGTGTAATRSDKDKAAEPAQAAQQPPRRASSLKPAKTGARGGVCATKPFMATAGTQPEEASTDSPGRAGAASPQPASPARQAANTSPKRGPQTKPSIETLAAPLAEAAGSPAPLNLDGSSEEPVELPTAPPTPMMPAVAPVAIEDPPSESRDFDDEPTRKFTRDELPPLPPGPGEQAADRAEQLETPYDLPPVTPSLRPAALGDSNFVAPSLRPPAMGAAAGDGASFAEVVPLSMRAASRAITVDGLEPKLKRSLVSLPVKWTVAVAITAIASFGAGLLVASGPVKVSVGDEQRPTGTAQPTPTPPAPTAQRQTDDAQSSAPTGQAPPAEAATTAAPSDQASQPEAQDGKDGSDLPAHEGYLVARCEKQSDAHVYVVGKPMGPLGEKLKVPCGLLNVRLGTKPLQIWYGKGRAIRVACQSVTEFDFGAPLPMAPGAEQGVADPAAVDDRYWIPPSL